MHDGTSSRSRGWNSRREFLKGAAAVAAGGLSAVLPLGCGGAKAKPNARAVAPTLSQVNGP
ncbi:MAG: twin-arginine translocation signal domain-containing protein, partial [Acidobacteriaceae bacterium]